MYFNLESILRIIKYFINNKKKKKVLTESGCEEKKKIICFVHGVFLNTAEKSLNLNPENNWLLKSSAVVSNHQSSSAVLNVKSSCHWLLLKVTWQTQASVYEKAFSIRAFTNTHALTLKLKHEHASHISP